MVGQIKLNLFDESNPFFYAVIVPTFIILIITVTMIIDIHDKYKNFGKHFKVKLYDSLFDEFLIQVFVA